MSDATLYLYEWPKISYKNNFYQKKPVRTKHKIIITIKKTVSGNLN